MGKQITRRIRQHDHNGLDLEIQIIIKAQRDAIQRLNVPLYEMISAAVPKLILIEPPKINPNTGNVINEETGNDINSKTGKDIKK